MAPMNAGLVAWTRRDLLHKAIVVDCVACWSDVNDAKRRHGRLGDWVTLKQRLQGTERLPLVTDLIY